MSCVLRVAGETFNVDEFLAGSRIEPCKIWHKGDAKSRSGKESPSAGFNADVSVADFDEFPAQVQDAIRFLRDNHDDLSRLSTAAGVSDIDLDFGIAIRPETMSKTCLLSPELIQLAGEFKIGIMMSYYACE
jgi:hypothetical protein